MKANKSKEKTPPQKSVYGARWKRRRDRLPHLTGTLYAKDLA
jgi:hypothetical protein